MGRLFAEGREMMNYAYISNYKIIQLCINLNILNKERSILIYNIVKKIRTYQPLFHYDQFRNLSKNHYLYGLDSIENKKCIFCLKDSTQVSFEKQPHVIPFLLGNNFLLHHEECDECNEFFGETLECELDKYLIPYRTLNRLTNRKGNFITTELSKNRTFRYEPLENTFKVELYESEVSFDDNSNILAFDLPKNKHIPMSVYKALLKIFFGLLPREYLSQFERLREWIISKDNSFILFSPLNAMRTQLHGFSTSILDVIILHKEASDFEKFKADLPIKEDFEFLALLRFGSIVYEFPLLTDLCFEKIKYLKKNNMAAEFNLPTMPKPGFVTNGELISFSKNEKVKMKETFYFRYDKVIRTEIE